MTLDFQQLTKAQKQPFRPVPQTLPESACFLRLRPHFILAKLRRDAFHDMFVQLLKQKSITFVKSGKRRHTCPAKS